MAAKRPAKAPAKKATTTTKATAKKAAAPRKSVSKTTAKAMASSPVVEPRPDPLQHIVQDDARLTRLPQDRNGFPAYAVSTGGFVWRDGNKWGYSVGESPYMNASEATFDTQAAALKALTG